MKIALRDVQRHRVSDFTTSLYNTNDGIPNNLPKSKNSEGRQGFALLALTILSPDLSGFTSKNYMAYKFTYPGWA